ncbi:MAG TPA: glycosyltransferase family 2 protein [archaeon]|nr:glycosyltransferase family 2 protein [archaeon]
MLAEMLFDAEIYRLTLWTALLVLGIVAFWNLIYIRGRKKVLNEVYSDYEPSVSVVIPAFNEQKTIEKTLKNIFDSDYPPGSLEILVVNDGSTDKTEKNVKDFIKKFDARNIVKIINMKANVGKCAALNFGVEHASGEVVITTDADTIFNKDSVRKLVAGFADEKVGAIAGYYKANQSLTFSDAIRFLKHHDFKKFSHYFLEKFQNLEYILFLFTRKRQEILDAIMVVPGAIGAFRKDVLRKIGGFDEKILIEDYDITLKVHKAGYLVKCYKDAEASTTPPQTWKELIGQRIRWYRGGLQVMAKHSDLLRSRHGFVSFVFGFEYVNVVLQFLIWSLFFSGIFYKVFILQESILFLLMQWINRIISLQFQLFDYILFVAAVLFLIGMFEAIQSVKLSRASRKTLLFYPLLGIYAMFLGYVWLYSFLAHVTRRKISYAGRGWKGR